MPHISIKRTRTKSARSAHHAAPADRSALMRRTAEGDSVPQSLRYGLSPVCGRPLRGISRCCLGEAPGDPWRRLQAESARQRVPVM
jgi:hypothetical protein